jgi:hypothetical protein
MPVAPMSNLRLKAAVTVTSMARSVKLSRSRFYDFIRRGVFPKPCYTETTKRPYYTADAQQMILEVRQSCIGCNGEFVIFYERSPIDEMAPTSRKLRTAPTPASGISTSNLLAGLASVGLTGLTPEQIEQAIVRCYPNGPSGHDEGTVLRTLNRHLRCATRVASVSGDRPSSVQPPPET